MTRALIYCRISSDPTGRAAGVSRQETECRELAKQLGWEVLEVLVDNDISAYSGKRRPAYEQLLAALRDGHADAIIAWHTDRLYRRSRDLPELIDIANENKIAIRTVTSGDIDLSTASGRMMARVVAAVNEHEIEHGQERMRLAKETAAAEGRWRGSSRPFGYEKDGVTIRAEEAREIKDAVRRMLGGESLRSILRDWLDRDVPTSKGGTWSMGSLRYVLMRARNAALIERRGEIVGPARWEPILTESEWHAICHLLEDPSRKTNSGPRQRRWLGSGLYRCGICGDGTTVRIATLGGANKNTSAYACKSGKHLRRAAAVVDKYVSAAIVEFLRSEELDPWGSPSDDVSALRSESNAIKVEIEGLRVALGKREIGLRDFQVASSGMNQTLEEIEEKLRQATAGSPMTGIADADDIEVAWSEAPIEQRRAIVDMLVRVTLLPGRPGRSSGGAYTSLASIVIERRDPRRDA